MNGISISSIKELFNLLKEIQIVYQHVSLNKEVIRIEFHSNLILDISIEKYGIFNVYVNSIFCYAAEEQDIYPSLFELIQDSIIIQFKKISAFRKPFKIILKSKFDIKKWGHKRNLRIITDSKVLLDNF